MVAAVGELVLGLLTAVLRDQMRQDHVVRNVAELVDRIPADAKPADTFTPAELQKVLKHFEGDRYAIAWQLALTGLRRGEVAGLRWNDIDLEVHASDLFDTAPVRQAPRRGHPEVTGRAPDTADT
ncbi:MAG: hypothetical protein WBM01_02960 [Mycobacterium sp.]